MLTPELIKAKVKMVAALSMAADLKLDKSKFASDEDIKYVMQSTVELFTVSVMATIKSEEDQARNAVAELFKEALAEAKKLEGIESNEQNNTDG